MKIFVTDSAGMLHQVEGESVVLELTNGKTIELVEYNHPGDRPNALSVWGGRQPQESWTEEDRHLIEQLNLTMSASNCVDIWPGRAKKQE